MDSSLTGVHEWTSRLLKILAMGFAALACSPILVSQAPSTRLTFTQKVSAPGSRDQIRAVVSAIGEDGQPIRDLSMKHFSVSVDGKLATITDVAHVAPNDRPIAMVLAMDISASMAGNHAFSAARNAAIRLMGQLGETDQVAIVTFGNSSTLALDFTTQKSKVIQALAGLNAADNRTLLYEGLLQSIKAATLATTGRPVVIAITDGKDEGSNVTLDDVVAKAKLTGVAVYTLGFGPEEDRKTLARMSELTGGLYRHAVKPEELPDLYQSILDELKDAYALRVAVPRLRAGTHDFSITLNYRDQKATANQEIKLPFPTLPIWLWVLVAGLAVLLVILAALGWVFTRRTRTKKRAFLEPAQAPLWVDVIEGAQRGRRVRLLGKKLRIGGARDCELWCDDPQVARHQADIVAEKGGATLYVNAQAKTPTFLNGNQLRPNESLKLRNGDRIKVGSMVLLFTDQRQSQPASSRRQGRMVVMKAAGG